MMLREEKIIAYLKEHVGESVSSLQLVMYAAAYEGDLDQLERDDLFILDDEVHRIAAENGFYLDMRHHVNKFEGLPFHLDFIIRRKRAG